MSTINSIYLSYDLIFAFMALIIAIVFAVLYLREFYLRQQQLKHAQKILAESQQQSLSIIHDAIKKSEDIISEAELAGIKTLSSSKLQTGKFEQEYVDQLTKATELAKNEIIHSKDALNKFLFDLREDINKSKLVKQSETALTKTAADVQESLVKTQAGFEQFLGELKTTINQSNTISQELIKQQVNTEFEKFEQNLSDFLTQTEQQSMKAVELEVKSARQLIDTYKTQQMALIDENIVAMLEKTLNLVLSKKLTLKDQLEIIYDSLEKAKAEKFIV